MNAHLSRRFHQPANHKIRECPGAFQATFLQTGLRVFHDVDTLTFILHLAKLEEEIFQSKSISLQVCSNTGFESVMKCSKYRMIVGWNIVNTVHKKFLIKYLIV